MTRATSAKYVQPSPSSRLAALARFAALMACFWSAAGAAGALRDPMRPPAQWLLPQSGVVAPVPSGPQLQSILFSDHERSATISGRRVKVGDRLGNARVVMISRNAVVLDVGGVSQTLKLFPDIGKRIITPNQRPKH